jgi:hypothetical protein
MSVVIARQLGVSDTELDVMNSPKPQRIVLHLPSPLSEAGPAAGAPDRLHRARILEAR